MTILSFSELKETCEKQNKAIFEIAQENESVLLDEIVDVVRLKVLEDLVAMKGAIRNGLKSTEKSISDWCGDDCEKLVENFKALMDAIVKAKPASSKGQYVKSVTLASTMGPGVKINGRI